MEKEVSLRNGQRLPYTALGTYKLDREEPILAAVEAGCRYFDTASFYRNEAVVGRALRQSGLARGDYQIASKLWKDEMGYEQALAAFERSRERLGVEYIDVYFIHWPNPELTYDSWQALDLETWRALEELYRKGLVKALGVSNFLPYHLQNLLDHAEIPPLVDQMELHPGYMQQYTVDFCRARGIAVQASRPLAKGAVAEEPTVALLAQKYGVTPAKLTLTFLVQCGIIPLPRSSNPQRIRENTALWDFSLEEADVQRLLTLPQTAWSGEHPDRERVR